jgi:2-polyprenyl-6-methoxyphenol hydroxylase-like FAD-dependent oxidoreductase
MPGGTSPIDRAVGSNASAVLAQLRIWPQIQLEAQSKGVTDVVFHTRTIATIDSDRESAEIAVSTVDVDQVLRDHADAEPGSIGVTVRLTSPSHVQTALALIRQGRNEVLYHWQFSSSGP